MDIGTLPQHSQMPGAFTCISCSVKFPVAELQRLHMKTEWHRYNLKRRVAGLTPVPASVFSEKVSNKGYNSEFVAATNNSQYNEDEFGFAVHQRIKKSTQERQVTKKDLKRQARIQERGRKLQLPNENDYLRAERSPSNSTVISRLSRFSTTSESSVDTTASLDTDDLKSISSNGSSKVQSEGILELLSDGPADHDFEDDATDDETDREYDDESLVELPVTTCFYCGVDNVNIEDNEKHMYECHGLYIPERSFVSDIEGLLDFIGHTITIDNECLKCGFQGRGLMSIRQHLKSKGHCVIPYETKEERLFWGQFYDFGSNEETEIDRIEDDNASDDSEEYTTTVQIHNSGIEMSLPNGTRLGHRSMQKYYRQTPVNPREVLEGERTVSLVYPNQQELLSLSNKKDHDKESSLISSKKLNKDLKLHVKRGNFQPYFKDMRIG